MRRILRTAVVAMVGFALVGCASEAEKEARRQNAFDLAGTYTATIKSGSSLDFVMTVTNESGRHDVLANVDRALALTNEETAFLQNKHNINPGSVSAFYTRNLVLGRGQQNTIEGGENISDDFGESSRVRVCSDTLKYNSTQTVGYCLSGNIRKTDYVLRGDLSLYVTTEVQKTDQNGQPYKEYQTDTLPLKFVASPDNVYFTQYFGTWSGSVTLNEDVGTDVTKIMSMTLQKVSDTAFQVSPPAASVTVQGQTYAFESKSHPTSQLSDKAIPLVEMTFRRSDTERVMFVGQIRSLGNMTGSIVWISGANRVHIGSFLYKRK